jgi:hypothetical protein
MPPPPHPFLHSYSGVGGGGKVCPPPSIPALLQWGGKGRGGLPSPRPSLHTYCGVGGGGEVCLPPYPSLNTYSGMGGEICLPPIHPCILIVGWEWEGRVCLPPSIPAYLQWSGRGGLPQPHRSLDTYSGMGDGGEVCLTPCS